MKEYTAKQSYKLTQKARDKYVKAEIKIIHKNILKKAKGGECVLTHLHIKERYVEAIKQHFINMGYTVQNNKFHSTATTVAINIIWKEDK